jgi:hypothetical protein
MILDSEKIIEDYVSIQAVHDVSAKKHFTNGIIAIQEVLIGNYKDEMDKCFKAGRECYTYKNGEILSGFSCFEDYWKSIVKTV